MSEKIRKKSLEEFKKTKIEETPMSWHVWKRAFDCGYNIRKDIYSEDECRNMVMDYAQFVIECMEGKKESLPVGIWFDRNKK